MYSLPEGISTFPITISSKNFDDLFNPGSSKTSCPNNHAAYKKYWKKRFSDMEDSIKPFEEYINKAGLSPKKIFNSSIWTIENIGTLESELRGWENYYGKSYPNISEDIKPKLRSIHSAKFTAQFEDDTIRRAWSFKLAKNILEGMEDFVQGSSNRKKLRLLIGHDTGVHCFTIGYNLTSSACHMQMVRGEQSSAKCEHSPQYASTYIYELVQDIDLQYYVRVIYDGLPVAVCKDNKNDHYCMFSDFQREIRERFYMDEKAYIQ